MSEKNTKKQVINPRDVVKCEACGDTIPHRYRGCVGKHVPRHTESKSKLDHKLTG